jgi:hypothetical protein
MEEIGASDAAGGVAVRYRHADGSDAYAKLRVALSGANKYRLPKGSSLMPYGLWRLGEARGLKLPSLVLVEGESDCWTLWHHGIPALGLPGASTAKCLEREHLEGIRRVYLVQERDQGGEEFISRASARIRDFGLATDLRVVHPPAGANDVNEAHQALGSGFLSAFREACKRAQPHSEAIESLAKPLSEIEAEEIYWMWRPYIPLGEVTIMAGRGGVGKSFLAARIAAAISSGAALPGPPEIRTPANVLIISAEDDPARVIRPRMERAGAVLSRVLIYQLDEHGFSLGDQQSMTRLELLAEKYRPRLVIIDPIVSFLGGRMNPDKSNEVRAALNPLADVARRQRMAILAVAHVRKGSSTVAAERILHSVDFVNSVRSALMVTPDPQDENGRLLSHVKTNLAVLGRTQRFTIRGDDDEAPYLEWLGESGLSGDEVSSIEGSTNAQEKALVDEAEEFLRDELMSGKPRLAKDLLDKARRELGISGATLKRAKAKLGVKSQKNGGSAGFWMWVMDDPRPSTRDPVPF